MKYWPLVLLGAAVAAPAHADLTGVYATQGGGMKMTMRVEVATNGDIRADMNVAGVNMPGMYLITRGGRSYFIMPDPAGPVVQDLEDVGAVMQDEMQKTDPHFCEHLTADGSFPSLVSRGTVTIAGRTGEAYGLAVQPKAAAEIVINRDPDLAPLGAALAGQLRMSMAMMGKCGAAASPFRQMQALLATGAPLKFGPMQLEKVETGPIDPQRFVLPAAPATRERIRALMTQKKGPQVTIVPRPAN